MELRLLEGNAYYIVCLSTRSIPPIVAIALASLLLSRAAVAAADPDIATALRDISPERIREDVARLVSFGTRSTISAQDPASIAAGHGIGAAREWLKGEFERYARACGGCLTVSVDEYLQAPAERVPHPTLISNVYAVLHGDQPTDAARFVVVSGHYDSRNDNILDGTGAAPGANDDASGTAVVLECARVLSRLHFPATVLFLTVAGEEQALNGSAHFAQVARADGRDIEAVLSNDIVGGDRSPAQDPRVVRVFSEGLAAAAGAEETRRIRSLGAENDSPSRELARFVADVAAVYDPGVLPHLVFRPDRYLRGGDHTSFNEQGYAAVRFSEFREGFEHQHQSIHTAGGVEYGDLPKFVDFDYVAKVARLNAAALAVLAAAPAPPAHVELLTANLEHSSTLRWAPVPRAARYEVLWRSTAAAEWQHVHDAGAATTATLKVSKDEAIFAVRSLDQAGHPSLPVVPLPAR
jgi:hypothetical protein